MAAKWTRLFLKATPCFFFFLVVYKIINSTGLSSTTSLLHTLNSLHESQRQIYNNAKKNASLGSAMNFDMDGKMDANSAIQMMNKKQAATVKPDDIFRSWFDNRPAPNVTEMKTLEGKRPVFFHGFKIESPDICGSDSVDVLVYVQSSPENREQRHAIRQSWAGPNTYSDISVKHVFFTGMPSMQGIQNRVMSEAATYKDIVQGDFLNSFKNLTRTAVTAYTWMARHCLQARYLIKADDDMFVDTFRVVSELIPKIATNQFAVAGHKKLEAKIDRKPGSKWYVDPEMCKGMEKFPPFFSGYFTLITGNLIPRFYARSIGEKNYVPDDVYIFGLLLQDYKDVERLSLSDKMSLQTRPDPVQELKANGKFEYTVFASGGISPNLKYWEARRLKLTEWEAKHNTYARDVLHYDKTKLVV